MNQRIKMPPLVMKRALPVCHDCWDNRNPTQLATGLNNGKSEECIVCEKNTNSGIYVQMTVQWDG